MNTFKNSRQFHGSPISFRAVCQLEDRQLPFSLLDFVRADGFRQFGGQISTGDVDCTWEMKVWENGFWSASGVFHDGGTIAGDFFFLELLLDGDHSVGAKLEGSILNVIDSRHLEVEKDGSDSWIRDNWGTFEGSGPTVRLHAAPTIGELVSLPFVALAAVPFVVYVVAFFAVVGVSVAVNLLAGGTFKVRRCPDDSPFPLDQNTSNRACFEIVTVPPPQQ